MNFLVFYLYSILICIGLAIDAFSISLTNGLSEPQMQKKKECVLLQVVTLFFNLPCH